MSPNMQFTDLELNLNHELQRESGETFELNVNTSLPLTNGMIGIYGASGHGKSTLLKLAASLLTSKSSEVVWKSTDEKAYRARANRAEQSPAVYQDQQVVLFEHLTVIQNLQLIEEHSIWQQSEGDKFSREKVIKWCGIEDLLQQKAESLSGGEKQRVGLARSVLSGKPIVLLDEPFSALDWQNRMKMLQIIKQLHIQFNIAFVIVSHSLRELAVACEHLIHIENGRIKSQGPCSTIIASLTRGSAEPIFSRLEVSFDNYLDKHHLASWRLNNNNSLLFTKESKNPNSSSTKQKHIITIEADKVSISRNPLKESSVLNQIQGSIIKIESVQHLTLVSIDIGGQLLMSLISQLSFERLQLEIGQQVYAQFKAV
jgi:molybdate transport system ATP-binding protein